MFRCPTRLEQLVCFNLKDMKYTDKRNHNKCKGKKLHPMSTLYENYIQ